MKNVDTVFLLFSPYFSFFFLNESLFWKRDLAVAWREGPVQHMLTSGITHVRIRHTGSGRVPARSRNAPVPLRRESSTTFLPSSPSFLQWRWRRHGSSCMIAVNIPVYIFLDDVCVWPCVLAFVSSMCCSGFHLCSPCSTTHPQPEEPAHRPSSNNQ